MYSIGNSIVCVDAQEKRSDVQRNVSEKFNRILGNFDAWIVLQTWES